MCVCACVCWSWCVHRECSKWWLSRAHVPQAAWPAAAPWLLHLHLLLLPLAPCACRANSIWPADPWARLMSSSLSLLPYALCHSTLPWATVAASAAATVAATAADCGARCASAWDASERDSGQVAHLIDSSTHQWRPSWAGRDSADSQHASTCGVLPTRTAPPATADPPRAANVHPPPRRAAIFVFEVRDEAADKDAEGRLQLQLLLLHLLPWHASQTDPDDCDSACSARWHGSCPRSRAADAASCGHQLQLRRHCRCCRSASSRWLWCARCPARSKRREMRWGEKVSRGNEWSLSGAVLSSTTLLSGYLPCAVAASPSGCASARCKCAAVPAPDASPTAGTDEPAWPAENEKQLRYQIN